MRNHKIIIEKNKINENNKYQSFILINTYQNSNLQSTGANLIYKYLDGSYNEVYFKDQGSQNLLIFSKFDEVLHYLQDKPPTSASSDSPYILCLKINASEIDAALVKDVFHTNILGAINCESLNLDKISSATEIEIISLGNKKTAKSASGNVASSQFFKSEADKILTPHQTNNNTNIVYTKVR